MKKLTFLLVVATLYLSFASCMRAYVEEPNLELESQPMSELVKAVDSSDRLLSVRNWEVFNHQWKTLLVAVVFDEKTKAASKLLIEVNPHNSRAKEFIELVQRGKAEISTRYGKIVKISVLTGEGKRSKRVDF